MPKLDGRVALVTGAGRGIGRAIAIALGREGARVVAAARSEDELKELVDEVVASGGSASSVTVDLSDRAQAKALIGRAAEPYGPVDILVNNAAVTWFIPVAEFPEKRFRTMLDVQVWAPFELAQICLPGMRQRGGGWILNISSHAAIHPSASANLAHARFRRGNKDSSVCKTATFRS